MNTYLCRVQIPFHQYQFIINNVISKPEKCRMLLISKFILLFLHLGILVHFPFDWQVALDGPDRLYPESHVNIALVPSSTPGCGPAGLTFSYLTWPSHNHSLEQTGTAKYSQCTTCLYHSWIGTENLHVKLKWVKILWLIWTYSRGDRTENHRNEPLIEIFDQLSFCQPFWMSAVTQWYSHGNNCYCCFCNLSLLSSTYHVQVEDWYLYFVASLCVQ